MDRRSFLRGALSVSVVAVADLPALAAADIPTIYSDGERDDWAGLQAMIDGKPFRVDGEVVVSAGNWQISGGNFVLGQCLTIVGGKSRDYFKITADRIANTPNFPSDQAIFHADKATLVVACGYFDMRGNCFSFASAVNGAYISVGPLAPFHPAQAA